MSTRCQLTVVQEGLGWEQKVTMYHHCDGYPEHIIPDIAAALAAMSAPYKVGDIPIPRGWEAGRAGKVAANLCAAHPGGFEPEDSHDLHGDIEYHYTLYVVNKSAGNMKEEPAWEVEIREGKEGFWDNATLENMEITTERTPLEKLAAAYSKASSAND